MKTKISIACQGGGSQTAFTAGALKALLDENIGETFDIVGISGTSGGALCAAMVWHALIKGERPPWRRLIDFWHDNTARDWMEGGFNDSVIKYLQTVNSGLLPAFQLSPSSPLVQMMASWISAMMPRKEFVDFSALLRKYLDFDEIASWGPRAQAPVLVVGAANVTTGSLAKFASSQQPIRLEHLLASACVPSIFPAVTIGEHAYWDGLFSDNPPIEELIRPRTVGLDNIPDEIWLIKINPTARKRVPLDPAEIVDRHNQLEGNISLFQQLEHLEFINDLVLADTFRPEFLAQFAIKAPIRHPKSFRADPDKPYHIPCIEMPEALQEMLHYEDKIDRSATNIDRLIAEGEASARAFLTKRAASFAAESGESGRAATAEVFARMWPRGRPRRDDIKLEGG